MRGGYEREERDIDGRCRRDGKVVEALNCGTVFIPPARISCLTTPHASLFISRNYNIGYNLQYLRRIYSSLKKDNNCLSRLFCPEEARTA